jgi:hypothetical protein
VGDLHTLLFGHRGSLIAAAVLALILGLGAWWLAPRLGWARGWSAFAAGWLGLILGLAVVRTGLHWPSFNANGAFWATCRRNPSLRLRNSQDLVNLVMFAPLAFAVTLASRRWWIALVVSGVLIALVEIAQAMLGTGICEGGDASRNFAGAVAGTAVAWLGLRVASRSEASVGA